MASTYSELKIELMADGEKTGQWGDITNVNLGTAIEEAITGSSNVEFSGANVTLTLVDSNASQTSRNLRLNLTGSTGAARDLIVPAIEKVYIVNNGCAHTVTVKNSTGTGIAVPAGKTMYVYNDGTNVVDAITHLTSLTLGTPLPVASGGTGSSTASFSGANITNLNASNVTAGTLANARTTATSANTVNAIVQRDASGNFSANIITASGENLTTLNASNISSGTLNNARLGTVPASNGGTGRTSLTANNVLVGNGTSAVNFVAPGASGNVLTSNGTSWTSAAVEAGGDIPAGTKMLFQQTAAPTGWTKDTTHNNKALRLVSGAAGTGGSVAFTTAFASKAVSGTVANHTLVTSQIPSHTHTIPYKRTGDGGSISGNGDGGQTKTTNATGGNGAHNHGFTGTAINLAVQYVDLIIATKD